MCRRGNRGRRGFPAQNLIHHRATSRAFAFDGFAPVLGRDFHCIGNLLLGFTFDAVTFGHRKFNLPGASCAAAVHAKYLRGRSSQPSTGKRQDKARRGQVVSVSSYFAVTYTYALRSKLQDSKLQIPKKFQIPSAKTLLG